MFLFDVRIEFRKVGCVRQPAPKSTVLCVLSETTQVQEGG